jgi:Family of unknown function (DUF5715)
MHRQALLFIAALLAVASAVVVRAADRDVTDLSATSSSQRVQNARADADDLSRMLNDGMVRRFRRLGLLVPVHVSTGSYYLHGIPARFRYLRPWARLFLTRLGRQFHDRFGHRLRVTGLIRTVQYQRHLDARNANAAPASGDDASTHLTGATLDISKRFMTGAEQRWVRRVLSRLRRRGILYAIEEFYQPCFHVMVYRDYLGYAREIS